MFIGDLNGTVLVIYTVKAALSFIFTSSTSTSLR